MRSRTQVFDDTDTGPSFLRNPSAPDMATLKRDLARALAEARHAWDYDRGQWPRWKAHARRCQARLQVGEVIARDPRLARCSTPADFDTAASGLERDLPKDWPRYEP